MDISSISSLPASPAGPSTPALTSVPVVTAPTIPVSANAGAIRTAGRDATSRDNLDQAIKQANDSFQQQGQNLYAAFEQDKLTGIDMVKIVDKKTNETILQMPPKEMVAFAQFLEDPQGRRGQLLHTTG